MEDRLFDDSAYIRTPERSLLQRTITLGGQSVTWARESFSDDEGSLHDPQIRQREARDSELLADVRQRKFPIGVSLLVRIKNIFGVKDSLRSSE